MEASETKWVICVLDIIAVNSLRLGGLHIHIDIHKKLGKNNFYITKKRLEKDILLFNFNNLYKLVFRYT